MVVPDNEILILNHLQGSWERSDKKVSFTIEGNSIKNIKCDTIIEESKFLLDFNQTNLKWQLTANVFGVNSALINFEKNNFEILIRDGLKIIPNIKITEVFHHNVWFLRIKT